MERIILTREELKGLNELMIGRGVPIEKDDTGYNRPDFQLMWLIGMLNTAYSEEECYLVAKTLLHYKNTQLADISEKLAETYDYYESRILEKLGKVSKSDEKDIACCEKHSKKDFEKKEISYEIHEAACEIAFKFDEFVSLNPKDYDGRWGGGKCCIPFNNVEKFLTDIAEIGSVGYKADEALLEFVSGEMLKILEEKERAKAERLANLAVKMVTNKNRFGNCEIALNINDKVMNSFLWSLKDDALSFVDSRSSEDKVIISCKPAVLTKLLEKLKEKGINTDAIKVEDNVKPAFNNASGNSLLDLSGYSLPFTPYEFQLKDASEIVAKKRAMIGHEMGCGKTFIAIMVGMSINTKKLVVCPESLRLNWIREIQNVDKTADISLVYSKDKDWKFGDWTVMGYQTATKFSPEILAAGIKCVFIDEAHMCKGVNNYGKPSTKRAEAMIKVTENADYVYLMTGTPMPTRNKDLYNELKMLKCPELEDVPFAAYGKKFCAGYNNGFGWDFSGNSNNKELHDILSPLMTRRLKKDVLPNLKKQRQFVRISGVSREYKAVERNLYSCEDNETYMGLAMKGRRLLSDLKMDTAVNFADTLVDAGESVVIVSEFNDTIDKLLLHYKDDACVIRGGISDAKKQQAIDDFQSGAKKVCILNTIAGGVGITLTKAHNMVILDYDWTPANMVQVEDRICRTGQTECCNIYYIYNEDALLDNIFMDMITDKSSVIDRVVDDTSNTVDLSAGKKSNGSYLDILKERTNFRKKAQPA